MPAFKFHAPIEFATDEILLSSSANSNASFTLTCKGSNEISLLADVFVVQRFLTLVRKFNRPKLIWSESAVNALKHSPGAVLLLSSAILLDDVTHETEGSIEFKPSVRVSLRGLVSSNKLSPKWFDLSDSIVCADYISRGWHPNFYSAPGLLRNRDEIEKLFNPIIGANIEGMKDADLLKKWKDSLVSVVYELFENTHIHARFDYDNATIKKDIIRAVTIRNIEAYTGGNENKIAPRKKINCLEISVFDSGVGIFGRGNQRPIAEQDELEDEWRNLRVCLEKHEDTEPLAHTHRGLGLYEVLRALHFLKGAIQIRTGRSFGYRSFFPGDIQQQMESKESTNKPGMPKSRLLDFNNPYRPTATFNQPVEGLVARTIVPLSLS